jgi:hypothetical protein
MYLKVRDACLSFFTRNSSGPAPNLLLISSPLSYSEVHRLFSVLLPYVHRVTSTVSRTLLSSFPWREFPSWPVTVLCISKSSSTACAGVDSLCVNRFSCRLSRSIVHAIAILSMLSIRVKTPKIIPIVLSTGRIAWVEGCGCFMATEVEMGKPCTTPA